jgi:asparagine synthase (glutamine-hydrolysing)
MGPSIWSSTASSTAIARFAIDCAPAVTSSPTESDSEIALHLYDERGMQAAAELRGEFAVIIADERQQAMIAIRDRFGIKPLYYSIVNGEVFFASEIKALLAMGVPAVWDLEGATGGIGRSHEKTEFAGISTVPPAATRSPGTATFASIRIGIGRCRPPNSMRRDTRSEAEVVADFRKALLDSVRQRLVADVEVASYLSGGIDSCAVLGLAQQSTDRPIRAFTLTFENPLYDEARVAEGTGQARRRYLSSDPDHLAARLPTPTQTPCGTPRHRCSTVTASPKYLLSRAVRDAGIKVVFTGEGADEMLGGYPYYRVDALNDNPSLSATERAALLDQMLGANPATRAFMMPTQVGNPEMKAIERRLGWLPATLNASAAMIAGMTPYFREDLVARIQGYQPLMSALDRLPLAQRVTGRDRLNQVLYLNSKPCCRTSS